MTTNTDQLTPAHQGSTVQLPTTLGLAPAGGSFDVWLRTEDGEFRLANVCDRSEALEVCELVHQVLAHWASKGLESVAVDSVEAAWRAADGHRTFQRMAGLA